MSKAEEPKKLRGTKWQEELRAMGEARRKQDLSGWEYHGHKPWQQFREGMRSYISELKEYFPSIEKDIVDLFVKAHRHGGFVRAWDICGMADAKEIGADETDCLTRTLPADHPLKTNPALVLGNRVFEGDIFTKEALDPLVNRAKERGAPLLIIMIVGAGFSSSGQREHPFARRMLAYQLHRAMKILAPGGHIYFQNPYWGQSGDKERDYSLLSTLVSKYGTLSPDQPDERFYRIIKFDQAT